LRQLKSEYVVEFLDCLVDKTGTNCFYMVMQYCEKGNLSEFIKENKDITDEQIIEIFIGILNGLILLNKNKIIHSDLKPENILLSAYNQPLIADFWISKQLMTNKSYTSNPGGSFNYVSPEQFFDGKLIPESDYYSLGVILYNLCGYDKVEEMYAMKFGTFPKMEGRKR